MNAATVNLFLEIVAETPEVVKTIQGIVSAWVNRDWSAVKALSATLPTAAQEKVNIESDIAAETALAHPGT